MANQKALQGIDLEDNVFGVICVTPSGDSKVILDLSVVQPADAVIMIADIISHVARIVGVDPKLVLEDVETVVRETDPTKLRHLLVKTKSREQGN